MARIWFKRRLPGRRVGWGRGAGGAVGLGAIAALWTVTVIAAFAGAQAGRVLTPTLLSKVSAVLFALIGVLVIVTAFQPLPL